MHRFGGEPMVRRDLAEVYDAFETPRADRGELPFLRAPTTRGLPRRGARARAGGHRAPGRRPTGCCTSWSSATSTSTTRRCSRRWPGAAGLLGPSGAAPAGRPPAGTPGSSWWTFPARHFRARAPRTGFAYDNERPRHRIELPAFRIGRTPVTNATFLSFAEGGGYERREWWTRRGLALEAGVRHHRARCIWNGDGREWRRRRAGRRSTRTSPSPTSPGSRPTPSPARTARAFPPRSSGRRRRPGTRRPGRALALPLGRRAAGPRARPTSTTLAFGTAAGRRPSRREPRPAAAWGCWATCGSGPPAPSAGTRASRPTPTASTPRSSSATATACCAAARGPPRRASPRRPSATGTFRERRQIFSGLRIARDA